MPKKTFNIGECSYHGRWKIEIEKKSIVVTGIDWDTKKEMETNTFMLEDVDNGKLETHLWSVSTSYWADTMMDWVREAVKSNPDYAPRKQYDGLWT